MTMISPVLVTTKSTVAEATLSQHMLLLAALLVPIKRYMNKETAWL